jgi:hypothetical protein
MRPGGGKAKGSEFEREICKKLSKWVSAGEREDLFWRSAMSGGRATVGRKKGLDHAKHAGDISATHPMGHNLTDKFYIECKYYADLKFDSWLLNGEGPLAGFWRTAQEQAADHKLLPMLIVKQNRSDVFMIVPAPAILAPGAAGISAFNVLATVARLHKAKADIFNFDAVMLQPFKGEAVRPFLKPGELTHILASSGPGTPMSKEGEKALASLASVVGKEMRRDELDRSGYYERVDKWINTKRRRDGVKKRMAQGGEDGEIQDTPRAGAQSTKPLRIRA